MSFSIKAVLSGYSKRDGSQQLALRAIIDRRPATVSLGICVMPKYFDHDKGQMKAKSPNADIINLQISEAVTRGTKIYLDHRSSNEDLTPAIFKDQFFDNSSRTDFIQFMAREMEIKRAKIEPGTYRHHKSVLQKLSEFRSKLKFSELSIELVQRYENWLISTKKNQQNTIRKNFKTINLYLREAERKNVRFKNPFKIYRVAEVSPEKPALSLEEVRDLFLYYHDAQTRPSHKKLLRYFLFSITTGLRISDVRRITWNNLHGDTLIFVPHKTKKHNKQLSIPLSEIQLSLLPDPTGKTIFECSSEQVANRNLKEIAAAIKIKKHLTYHISRHTFATLFLDRGGKLDTLQQLLGHADISTTMQYVKINEARKREEMSDAFNDIFISD